MAQLTAGCIQTIKNGTVVKDPVVQVLSVKPMKQGQRYKIEVSDGSDSLQGMLASQKNEMVLSGDIKPGSILSLTHYSPNDVQGRQVVIILECALVGHAPLVDNPVKTEKSMGGPEQPQESPSNTFQQHQPQAMQTTPQAVAPSRFGGSGSGHNPVVSVGNVQITPIRALQQFLGGWTIKARIANKSDIKRWDKGPNQSGQLFSITLVDAEGTEIRATFFRDAVDKYFEMIQENSVYTFSKGKIKLANKTFSRVNNEYELVFDSGSDIHLVPHDNSIQEIVLQRTTIAQMHHLAPDSFCDMLGVATDIGEVQEFVSKAGKPLTKLEVTIADESGASIRATIWGDKAKDLKPKLGDGQGSILAIKGARISDWGGRTVSAGDRTQILINPELPEVAVVKKWFDAGGSSSVVSLSKNGGGAGGAHAPKPLTERYTMQGLTNLGQNGQADFTEVEGTLTFFQEQNLWYHARPGEGSKKKVRQNADGTWHCEATNEDFTTKETRYMMRVVVSDYTGAQYVNVFNNEGIKIIGKTGDEMEQLQTENAAEFKRVMMSRLFENYVFRLKVAEETYNEVTRKKYSVASLREMDWAAECNELLGAIAQYN